jgi:hypothetical protein
VLDGGVNVAVKINGQQFCNSEAVYGGDKTRQSKDENGKSMATLSGQTDCPDMVPVKKGDKLSISAYFDLGIHPA